VSDRPARGDLLRPSGVIVGLLLTLRVLILVIAAIDLSIETPTEPTLVRFHEVGQLEGRAWRDYPLEFAPGQFLVVRLIARDDISGTAFGVAVLAVTADLATFWMLRRGWGRSASGAYLVLGLPLLAILPMRLDGVAVALAVAAMWAARRARSRVAGVLMALAMLTRVWPVVLLPVLALRRGWRGVAWAAASGAIGTLAWLLWSDGSRALLQVASFRGATGWEVGSTAGSIGWLVTGGPVRLEAGAFRVGTLPPWAYPVLAGLLSLLLVAVWLRARSETVDPAGAPSAAAVAGILFLAPVFSDGYVSWLLPWAAIASTDPADPRRSIGLLTLAAATLTLADRTIPGLGTGGGLFLLRDLAVGAIVLVWLMPREARGSKAASRSTEPGARSGSARG